MKTKIEVIIFFLFLSFNLNAQNDLKFAQRIIILGNSLTYMTEYNDAIPARYHEFTWNKNISINITPNIYTGISYQNIYTSGSTVNISSNKNKYHLVGVFFQYDFLPKVKNKLFVETSWNYGNYCTCGNKDPYEVKWVNYIGFGGGYELPLNDIISLDLSFILYRIIENIESKYNYTQYVVGLNIDLINQKK